MMTVSFQTVCEHIQHELARLPIPGAAVGVLFEDQEQTAGFGFTSVENPLPVTPDTLFQIGSITKTFVATLVMRLVEQGKLELDAPVKKYLPELMLAGETVADRVTLRHLLTHTAGWIGDYFDDTGRGDDAQDKMVRLLRTLPQLTPLGEVFSYNNSGFYLAGRVIEVVTGKPFETAMREFVFEPLGLTRSFFFPEDVITYRFVVGHEKFDTSETGKQPRVARPWALARAAAAAGGIISQIPDLFRYARFHMGDGPPLLEPDSLTLMQTTNLPASGLESVGLSWFIREVGGYKMVGHGGATNGQITLLQIIPEAKFAFALFTNGEDGSTLTRSTLKVALESFLGITVPEETHLVLDAGELETFRGDYEATASHIRVTTRDEQLVLNVTDKGGFPTPDSPPPATQPPPVRVAFYKRDGLIVLDEPFENVRAEFLRDAQGNIEWLLFGQRVHRRLPPSP
jgi:CubicO group peptidase (beta-lactamase class C family)